jgi:hypothetical protein
MLRIEIITRTASRINAKDSTSCATRTSIRIIELEGVETARALALRGSKGNPGLVARMDAINFEDLRMNSRVVGRLIIWVNFTTIIKHKSTFWVCEESGSATN